MALTVTGHGLVLPDETPGATSSLNAAYGRYLAASCQRFLGLAGEWPAAQRADHARAAAVVRQALGRSQKSVLACFASPAVSTALQCFGLRSSLPELAGRIEIQCAAIVPHLLLELALRRLIPEGQDALWSRPPVPLAALALGGSLQAPRSATGLRFASGCIDALGPAGRLASFRLKDGAIENEGFIIDRCYWRVGKGTRFATIDHNPIASFEAHPDKAGNHIDLGRHSPEQWVEMLAGCFRLIDQFLPAESAEMATLLHEILPVGFDRERHLSASYREAIGTVYLTLHPSWRIMTEAIIHEFQHNKLNVASYSVEFLHNAFEPLYKSPVRPDPRPLWGILLAVHAFLPVAEFYRRLRDGGHPESSDPDFERRLAEIDLKNHEGMEMLRAHAELTPAGRLLFEELEIVERRHMGERRAQGPIATPTEIHLA